MSTEEKADKLVEQMAAKFGSNYGTSHFRKQILTMLRDRERRKAVIAFLREQREKRRKGGGP